MGAISRSTTGASLQGMAVSMMLVLVFLAASWSPAEGHGMMVNPPARNWLAYLNWRWDWPDGMNAGGYRATGGDGAFRWPAARYTLCGDATTDNKKQFLQAGPIQATYKAGQVINVDVLISTNHYGRFTFRLCPPRATQMSQCTELERADGKGKAWDLPAIAQGAAFKGGATSISDLRPIENDGSYSWYPLPKQNCKWWSGCFTYTGFPVYRLKYKLPKGKTCDRCILHWHYVTNHKCHVPCLPSDKYYPNCRSNPKFKGTYLYNDVSYCGGPYAAQPEVFFNCADVRVTK